MKVKGYSNYEVYPEEGKIWSYISNRFIGANDKDGYLRVRLRKDDGSYKNWGLHRFIWYSVNGEIPDGYQINHIDENVENNSIFNMNLMSPKENSNWGTRNERIIKNRTGNYVPKPIVALQNDNIQKFYVSTRDAERNGYFSSSITLCCNGKRKTAYGYKWQYVDDYLADWWEEEMEKATF